jgi:hypothetical protein
MITRPHYQVIVRWIPGHVSGEKHKFRVGGDLVEIPIRKLIKIKGRGLEEGRRKICSFFIKNSFRELKTKESTME